jgi:hypothetical protein
MTDADRKRLEAIQNWAKGADPPGQFMAQIMSDIRWLLQLIRDMEGVIHDLQNESDNYQRGLQDGKKMWRSEVADMLQNAATGKGKPPYLNFLRLDGTNCHTLLKVAQMIREGTVQPAHDPLDTPAVEAYREDTQANGTLIPRLRRLLAIGLYTHCNIYFPDLPVHNPITLRDLTLITPEIVLQCQNVGQTTLHALRRWLAKRNLRLANDH